MSGAGVMRVKKLKGNGIITVAARHNRRVIQAEMGAAGSIDPARSHLNETLTGPSAAADVGQLAKDLMTAAGVVKLRKDAVMGLEIVFSLPSDTAIDDRAYFTACAEWAGLAFGGALNVLSADIHRDEAAPHCHVLLLPLIEGRMIGNKLLGGKQMLMALQKDFHAAVASKFGLSKAPARLAGTAKQAGAKAVLQKLRETSDGALQSAAWAVIREAVERDPAPFLLALGIEQAAPKKKLRTFTQIMTSKGKGPSKEANAIAFAAPAKDQRLCSVAFASKPPVSPPADSPTPAPPPDDSHDLDSGDLETVRVRDGDLDAAMYDATTGEFFKRPPAPARHQRQAADAWVRSALTAQAGLQATQRTS
ncbi:MAG: hypothetical protein JWP93_1545 [Polaromonas sp.]|nr:hypothetical protein [Polaromonas sp.]